MRVAMAILLTLGIPAASACSKKLDAEACERVLSRGVGLAAFPSAEVVPIDMAALRQRAKGPAKQAFADFDQLCIGKPDDDVSNCARRANDATQFAACGPIVAKAKTAGEVVAMVVAKKHTADECSKLAEHAVKIGAKPVDDVSAVVTECDGTLEQGFFLCRLNAKDKAAWDACD